MTAMLVCRQVVGQMLQDDYTAPVGEGRGVEYCDQFVCLSVHEHVSGTA